MRTVRRSARVLVADAADRVLLYRYRRDPSDPAAGTAWTVPGGGVEPGETLAETAARELFEETGLLASAADLGRPVAVSAGAADLPWASERWFSAAYFFHRVTAHDPDGSGLQPGLERDSHDGFRWWTVPELVGTTESVYPPGLAGLMVDLLAGRLPTEPVRLPWHH